MDINIWYGLIIFVSVLLCLSWFLKKLPLLLFSGIGAIFLGLMTLGGIHYVSSVTVTDINSTVSNIVYNYTLWPSTYTIPLALFFLIIGLACLLLSAIAWIGGKSRFAFDDEEGSASGDDYG